MPRVPLLSGTRIAVVDTAADGVVLRPPPPGRAIADVRASPPAIATVAAVASAAYVGGRLAGKAGGD